MRKPRILGSREVNYYHVMSRGVNRDYILGGLEKEFFLRTMRKLEGFYSKSQAKMIMRTYEEAKQYEDEHGCSIRLNEWRKKYSVRMENLSTFELLRCHVRHFNDGVALGSRLFIEKVFEKNRQQFSQRRKTGARKIRGSSLENLCTLRDLRLNPISVPSG